MHRRILPTAIVMRRPRYWRCIVWVKAETRMLTGHLRAVGVAVFAAAFSIQLKSERLTESRQGSFGGICFSCLESDVVHFTRRDAAAFARAVAFTNNGCSIGLHSNPHSSDIDGQECAAVFACQHTAGFDGLSVPTIKAKDPVGFRDRVPSFDVGELASVGLARADRAGN